jgi:hypothetical protein
MARVGRIRNGVGGATRSTRSASACGPFAFDHDCGRSRLLYLCILDKCRTLALEHLGSTRDSRVGRMHTALPAELSGNDWSRSRSVVANRSGKFVFHRILCNPLALR